MPPQSYFCSQCGYRLGGRRSGFFWLLGIGLLGVCALIWIALSSFSNDSIEEAIEGQLEALKSHQLTEAYYAYTSNSFQQTISLEKFKDFVHTYPILIHYQEMIFGKEVTDGRKGSVTLVLASGGQNEAEIHYELVKEDGEWKIDRVELDEYRKRVTEDTVNATAAMIAPIKEQLQALRNGDLIEAYKNLVSKQFQKQTPFESFKAFVIAHPILNQHQNYDFKEHEIVDNRGIATILLHDEEASSKTTPVEYRMINEDGQWKILLMRVAAQDMEKETLQTPEKGPDTSAMIEMVRRELSLFEEGKIRKVYDEMIAKETQASVSFDNFQTFVQTYPAFSHHTAVNIREPSMDKGVGRIVAELIDDNGTTVVEYNVSFEEGSWKILGMHIASIPEESVVEETPSSYKMRDLINVIEAFLAALRSKETVKAYELTSKEFQYANSQNDFDLFFTKHPEFAQSQSSRFEKETFNNAIATFSGHLILADNKIMPVEFDLVQQDGQWKILHLYALPLENAPQESQNASSNAKTFEFTNLQLGTKVDDEGHILNPTQVFKTDAGDIFARLAIRNGTAGMEITLTLRHIESGSTLKPVSAKLNDNGDDTLTFLFSPPPKGWPKGSYQMRAASSSNVFKNFTFTVE